MNPITSGTFPSQFPVSYHTYCELPPLSSEQKSLLHSILDTPLKINSSEGETLAEIRPLDLLHYLASKLEAKIEIVGGLARYILLPEQNPGDYDIRFLLPEGVSLDICRQWIECYLGQFIPHGEINKKVFLKRCKVDSYSIFAFGDRVERTLELIFTHKLERDHLFSHDAFAIHYGETIELVRGTERSFKDLETRTLSVDNPNEVNHMGFPMVVSYYTRGYSYKSLNDIFVLQRKTFQHTSDLFSLLQRCKLNHHDKNDPFAEIALVLNCCRLIFFTENRAVANTLLYQAKIEINHPLKLWHETCETLSLDYQDAIFLLECFLLLFCPKNCQKQGNEIIWQFKKSRIILAFRPQEAFNWLLICSHKFPIKLYEAFITKQLPTCFFDQERYLIKLIENLIKKDAFRQKMGRRLRDLSPPAIKERLELEENIFQLRTITKQEELIDSLKKYAAFNPPEIKEKLTRLITKMIHEEKLSICYRLLSIKELAYFFEPESIKRKMLLKALTSPEKFQSVILNLSCDLLLSESHLAITSLVNAFKAGDAVPDRVKKYLITHASSLTLEHTCIVDLMAFLSKHHIPITISKELIKNVIPLLNKEQLLLLSQLLHENKEKDLLIDLINQLLILACQQEALEWMRQEFVNHPMLGTWLKTPGLLKKPHLEKTLALFSEKAAYEAFAVIYQAVKEQDSKLAAHFVVNHTTAVKKFYQDRFDSELCTLLDKKLPLPLAIQCVTLIKKPDVEKLKTWLERILGGGNCQVIEACNDFINGYKDKTLLKMLCLPLIKALARVNSEKIEQYLNNTHPLFTLEGLENKTMKQIRKSLITAGLATGKSALLEPLMQFRDDSAELLTEEEAETIDLKLMSAVAVNKTNPTWSEGLKKLISLVENNPEKALRFKLVILDYFKNLPKNIEQPELLIDLLNSFKHKYFFDDREALIIAQTFFSLRDHHFKFTNQSYHSVIEQIQLNKRLSDPLTAFSAQTLIPEMIQHDVFLENLSLFFTIILSQNYRGSELIPIWIDQSMKRSFNNAGQFAYILKFFSKAHHLYFHKNAPTADCLDVMFSTIIKGFTVLNSFKFFIDSLAYFMKEIASVDNQPIERRQWKGECLGLGCPSTPGKPLTVGAERFLGSITHMISFTLVQDIEELEKKEKLLQFACFNIKQMIDDFPEQVKFHINLFSNFVFSPLAKHDKIHAYHLKNCLHLFHSIDGKSNENDYRLKLTEIYLHIKKIFKELKLPEDHLLSEEVVNHKNQLMTLIKNQEHKHMGALLFAFSLLLLIHSEKADFSKTEQEILNLLKTTHQFLKVHNEPSEQAKIELIQCVVDNCFCLFKNKALCIEDRDGLDHFIEQTFRLCGVLLHMTEKQNFDLWEMFKWISDPKLKAIYCKESVLLLAANEPSGVKNFLNTAIRAGVFMDYKDELTSTLKAIHSIN